MIAEVAHFFLILACALSLGQAVLTLSKSTINQSLQRKLAGGVFACLLVSFAGLVWVFATSDFSVVSVAQNSHTAKPFLYKIAASWGHHEGSLVLWSLILAGFGWWAARSTRLRIVGHHWVLGVQGALTAAFTSLTVITSNPFLRLDPPPLQGASLNPILQDPSLAFHPPLLYVGYVGFSIVFAYAIAALLTGRADADWARAVRPFALVAWSCLTFGIGLGSYWAYYELGWGGWWFWDPVENASLLPWLSGTALVHSLVVLQKRGLFAPWAVFLAIISFSLSILGTFLVRSGVLTSVHAFALDPVRGYAVLLIFLIFSGGALLLFGLQAHRLSSPQKAVQFSITSREGMMTLNTLMLAVLTFTVLVGTIYPLILEGLTGQTISVGPPYYHQVFTPISALILLILPFGMMTAWRRSGFVKTGPLWWAGLACAATLILGLGMFHVKHSVFLAAAVLGVWVIVVSVLDLLRRPVKTMGVWGMTLAHIGVGALCIGAVAENAFNGYMAKSLAVGERLEFDDYTLTLDGVSEGTAQNYMAMTGQVTVQRAGGGDVTLQPERRYYFVSGQTTTEAAIRPTPTHDLYATIGPVDVSDGTPRWSVRLAKHPMIPVIYLGFILMTLGGAMAAVRTIRGRA